MSLHHKEVRTVIESIDALYKVMDKESPHGTDYPCVMIEVIRSLLSTDFKKADLYHHGMSVGYYEWKEYFDKDHEWYVGPTNES